MAVMSSPGASWVSIHGVSLGRAVEVGQRDRPLAPIARDPHPRVEREQRVGEIAGIGRDALVADPQHRVQPVLSGNGGAAAARHALVAGRAGIAEIAAAGALEQVAAERRQVAHLRRGAEQQRLGEDAIAVPHLGMRGRVAHPHQRAEPQHRAIGVDAVEAAKARHVEDPRGRAQPFAHELDHVGAAGEEIRPRAAGGVGTMLRAAADHVGERVRAGIGEGRHQAFSPAAWRIAATMFE